MPLEVQLIFTMPFLLIQKTLLRQKAYKLLNKTSSKTTLLIMNVCLNSYIFHSIVVEHLILITHDPHSEGYSS